MRLRTKSYLIRTVSVSLSIFVLSGLVGTVGAIEVYALAGSPNFQGSPAVTEFSSISNFETNSGGVTTNRVIAQGSSCDFSIGSDGTFYYIAGDASTTGSKQVFSWPSVSDWANNTNGTDYGSRSDAVPMSGMAIYGNELYILEGSMSAGGSKTLNRWTSIASWVSGDAPAQTYASRLTGFGIGFDIDNTGNVYFLDTNNVSPTTATSGILYSWATINDFVTDTNTAFTGNFTFLGGNQVAGLAVVPEPSTWIFAGLSCAVLAVETRRRSRRIAVS